ncbi:MAG: cation-transporting P-type ATPase [Chloroflexi bacterium]|nr:cation-transporting P-type ATPase [Chloroflexota bacterium]
MADLTNEGKTSSNDRPVAAMKPVLGTEELVRLPIEELLLHLDTSQSGLSSEQAVERLEVYGTNELARGHKHSAIKEFLLHFKSPLVIILLIAGVISGFLEEWANTSIILTIIFVSVILDFYQERKAEKAAELLKQKVTSTATVLRDGVRQEIKLTEIVPGDIFYLSAGDIAPADARVLNAKDLFSASKVLGIYFSGSSCASSKTVRVI